VPRARHIHLILEADDPRALGHAMRSLGPRIARGLNAVMRRRGRVVADRYHLHVLRTPTEVRHALQYVRDNGRKHLAQEGRLSPPGWKDPFSSEAEQFAPDLGALGPPNAPPRTWLLVKAVVAGG